MHGQDLLYLQIMLIPVWNVPTKEFVIEILVNVNVSKIMMVWPVKEQFVQTIVPDGVFVWLKRHLLRIVVPYTPLHGMQKNMLGANVMSDIVVQIVPKRNVLQEQTFLGGMVTLKDVIAQVEVYVITVQAFASAFKGIMEIGVNIRQFLDKAILFHVLGNQIVAKYCQ